jgi:hypothetical protein
MIIFSVLRSLLEKSTSPSIPFPDTLKGVDDLIRISLEGFRDSCFNWLLAATLLVVVGLVFEGPELWHEITSIVSHWRFWRRFGFSLPEEQTPNWAKLLAFIGWTLIIVGVAGEFVADTFVSRADGFVQKFDEILLAETTKNAGDARTSAEGAARAAKIARDQSDEAVASASHALALAQHATQEADSFEEDIKSAKKQADAAESHLNEALQRAADVTAELKRLTTPRRVLHTAQVVSSLKIFSGTEYLFTGTCGDTECFDLVEDIDDVLRSAGWKRAKSLPLTLGIPQYKIGGSAEFKVPGNVSVGISISVETPKGFDSIQNLAPEQQAEHIRAAITLNQLLISNVSPPEHTGKQVGVDTGTSTVVRIDVGRKP